MLFGPPGGGKSHLAAAVGLALSRTMARIVHAPAIWSSACRSHAVNSPSKPLAKLDKYHLLILDDIVYVSKDQAETSVLFELIGSRYERRSMLITANAPFGEWARSSQTKP